MVRITFWLFKKFMTKVVKNGKKPKNVKKFSLL